MAEELVEHASEAGLLLLLLLSETTLTLEASLSTETSLILVESSLSTKVTLSSEATLVLVKSTLVSEATLVHIAESSLLGSSKATLASLPKFLVLESSVDRPFVVSFSQFRKNTHTGLSSVIEVRSGAKSVALLRTTKTTLVESSLVAETTLIAKSALIPKPTLVSESSVAHVLVVVATLE